MEYSLNNILFFTEILIFASVILMHLVKKQLSLIVLYTAQSVVTTVLLLISSMRDFSASLLMVTLFIFVIKVIVAPYFFFRLIRRKQLHASMSGYLSVPLTLIALTVLTALAHSHFSKALALLASSNDSVLLLAIATILSSLFLIINHHSAISQMIGILSLENGIVSFAATTGLEQTPGLQIGVTFDLLVWIIIATVFLSMVYRQFGTLDVGEMKHLKEE